MEQSSDEEIWRRVLDGDARAFALIWDRHRDRVFRALISLRSEPTDAEDLSAITFLELWRRRRQVRFVDASLLPWLLVTAHNVHRNAARARRRHRALLSRIPAAEHAPDPADLVADGTPLTRAVREVLDAARPDDRVLLALTVLDGLTVREAALALGIGESAAKMRLSRLRRRISDVAEPMKIAESAPILEGEIT